MQFSKITELVSTHRCQPVVGGGGRTRTDDRLLAKQELSQLSYAPEGDKLDVP
tara:strand:- start:315 stop:473 length:159 start_codon:yes stop_codon:yes gene_type:complete